MCGLQPRGGCVCFMSRISISPADGGRKSAELTLYNVGLNSAIPKNTSSATSLSYFTFN
jgi:hypothetical protein